jgi:hypothetical protein
MAASAENRIDMPLLDPKLIDSLVQRQVLQEQANQTQAPHTSSGPSTLAKILYASGAGADMGTTLYAQAHGAKEKDPLVSWAGRAAVPVGAAMEGGGVLLASKLLKNHPKIMNAVLMGLGGMHGGAAAKNLMTMHGGSAPPMPSSAMPTNPNAAPRPGMVQLPDGSWVDPAFFPNVGK